MIASGSPAGDDRQAFPALLPAATTNTTPSATADRTAKSSAEERAPPSDKFATAGVPATWFAITQSMPAMTAEVLPEPEQSSTRTGTIATPGATP